MSATLFEPAPVVATPAVASPEALASAPDLGWQRHQMPLLGMIGIACLVLCLAAFIRGGLYLRDARVRAVLRAAR